MKFLIVLCLVVMAALAHGATIAVKSATKAAVNVTTKPAPRPQVIVPFIPFPHIDEFFLYKVNDVVLVGGSHFLYVHKDGHCMEGALGEDLGGFCPVNQTVCDQIKAQKCAPAVANMTCIESNHLGKFNATTNQGYEPKENGNGKANVYPHSGPLCYVETSGYRFQPRAESMIFMVAPKIQTCYFSVAPAPALPVGHHHHHAASKCPFTAE